MECLARECPERVGRGNPFGRPKTVGDVDCIDKLCSQQLSIVFSCVGRLGFGDCEDDESTDCAHTEDGNEIVICGRSLPSRSPNHPLKGCTDIKCVLLHEIMHVCGFQHNPHNVEPVSPREACKCFNCTRFLFPECDGYFSAGKRRYKAAECDELPSTEKGESCLP